MVSALPRINFVVNRARLGRCLTMLTTGDILRNASPTVRLRLTLFRKPLALADHRPPFTQTRAFDLLAAAPLMVWYCFAVVGIAIKSTPQFAIAISQLDWRVSLALG